MAGPPKVPSPGKKKEVKFVDPDVYETKQTWNKALRNAILFLRRGIGNDGALEGKIVDSLRFINYTKLNASNVEDELAARQVSVKRPLCKHHTKQSCLVFLIYQTIQAWHKTEQGVPTEEFLTLFKQLEEIGARGLHAAKVLGNEIDGHTLSYGR